MDVTIVLGDRRLPKGAAISAVIARSPDLFRATQVFSVDYGVEPPEPSPSANPDYRVRAASHRSAWRTAIRELRGSEAENLVLIGSAFSETIAGPEVVVPMDLMNDFAATVRKAGGSLQVLCLIDDVYAVHSRDREDLGHALTRRQLEWTFSQYLGIQLGKRAFPVPVRCLSLQHPLTNLQHVLLRSQVPSIYLCYPINVFRRDPDHHARPRLEAFKVSIYQQDAIVYDPLGIDEEVLISSDLGYRGDQGLTITSGDRWSIPPEVRTVTTEPELDALDGEILVPATPTTEVSRQVKAQVPQRDFFWIESSDVVVCWRPFLDNTHHAGVLSELQFAIHKSKKIIAYSPPDDGGERASPFAAMVPVIPDESLFLESIRHHTGSGAGAAMSEPVPSPKYCDHTSVGILIYNQNGELLLIERGTFPFGMAPPAGHVDEHEDFEEAAVAEVKEEVGLDVRSLRLVAEGRRENPCRRINGTWHYWRIFEAEASGNLVLSPREAKRAEWCSGGRLVELGLASYADATTDSPMEGVWLDWFRELNIVTN